MRSGFGVAGVLQVCVGVGVSVLAAVCVAVASGVGVLVGVAMGAALLPVPSPQAARNASTTKAKSARMARHSTKGRERSRPSFHLATHLQRSGRKRGNQ